MRPLLAVLLFLFLKPKRDPRMTRLRRKRARALASKAPKWRRRVAFLEHRIAKVRARRHSLAKVVGFDGCPCPLGIKLVLLDARRNGWTGQAVSIDRRYPYAERFGKKSQKALYEGWIRGLPGYNPANPPGQSSHELRGDGTVGELRQVLPWWRIGMDTSMADQLRDVLNRLGYKSYRPYADPREQHHTNLRANPRLRLIERGVL